VHGRTCATVPANEGRRRSGARSAARASGDAFAGLAHRPDTHALGHRQRALRAPRERSSGPCSRCWARCAPAGPRLLHCRRLLARL
jgi:hypothetical protein